MSLQTRCRACYSVALEKGRLTYRYLRSEAEPPSPEELPQNEGIKPSVKQWHTFRRTLDRLNVWCWREHYPNPHGVCDGTSWSVEIVYTDKAITSGGTNRFPDRNGKALGIATERNGRTFAEFCQAVSQLVGEFH